MKVLISFIGTGKQAANEDKKEYETALYQLPNEDIVESSLITSVLFDYLNPNKLIVIGTSKSIWSELSHIKGLGDIDNEEVYKKIFEETWSGEVSNETLKEWENFLKKRLNKSVSLNIIPISATEEIVEILYSQIPQNAEEIYLDITHAFRHFPLIAAFSLPVLKYVKNFNELSLIYAMFKSKPAASPVIFMELPNQLIQLLEAVSLTENAGNFEKFSDILGINNLKELYLKVETNRKISNKKFKNIINEIRNLESKSVINKISSEVLQKIFEDLKGDYLSLRMAKRAVFFAKRKQFLKAYTLIYEALINTRPEASWKAKKRALRNLLRKAFSKSDRTTFETIEKIRNIMAHGDDNELSQELNDILSDEGKLVEYVEKGKKLVDKLLETSPS